MAGLGRAAAYSRGATRSYQEIANAIGKPKAVRAVASACASNHLALVIPCHRVIREDKGLGVIVGEWNAKNELLKREQGEGSRG
jgi:O-6-methylguanine DNA methyltransferase